MKLGGLALVILPNGEKNEGKDECSKGAGQSVEKEKIMLREREREMGLNRRGSESGGRQDDGRESGGEDQRKGTEALQFRRVRTC